MLTVLSWCSKYLNIKTKDGLELFEIQTQIYLHFKQNKTRMNSSKTKPNS